MATNPQFGGNWTEEKLNRVKKYLEAYRAIFTKNPKASFFKTTYLDAFAGTGFRSKEETEETVLPLLEDTDAKALQKGSSQIALEIKSPFSNYIFIDSKSKYAAELENLKASNPQLKDRMDIVQDDANKYLKKWCGKTDWSKNRAVVFLDPYGMEVEWETIRAIAETKGIDLWILFPLGQAVNRLLLRDRVPEGTWASKLTLFFGTDDWKTEFYKKDVQHTLFGEAEVVQKNADFKSISRYFVRRLKEIFPYVAETPLWLRNSKNVPLYLLCFAAGNEKGGKTAIKIANNILKE